MRYFIFLFTFITLSCSKEAIEPESYSLQVQNRYFEAVTVSVGEHFSQKLSPNSTSEAFALSKGTYKVVAITASRLRLESNVQIQGDKEKLTIDICPKGKISVVH
ncbi:hypothetical protein RCZ04_17580 [Capnocytophaga sp. HP1101]